MSTLLKYHGHNLDEAMIFGIAHALTFVWMPLIKLNGMPLVSYRTAPRSIIKNTCKALGLKLSVRKFSDAQSGQAALDAALSSGKLAGLQTSVFWLPYFPPQMRFHFNAHNLLVYGKDGNDYLISDPVFETVQRCAAEDLQRARFVKGVLAAKGMMYTLEDNRPSEKIMADLPAIIRKAIRKKRQTYARASLFHRRKRHPYAGQKKSNPCLPNKMTNTKNCFSAIWCGCRKKSVPAAQVSAISTPTSSNKPPISATNLHFRRPRNK